MHKITLTSLAWLLVAFVSRSADARPEYAVRHGYVNCAVCHSEPQGSGPRNIRGKEYGAHDIGPGWLSTQDIGSADVRMLAVYPKHPEKNFNGLILMTTMARANLPLNNPKDPTAT